MLAQERCRNTKPEGNRREDGIGGCACSHGWKPVQLDCEETNEQKPKLEDPNAGAHRRYSDSEAVEHSTGLFGGDVCHRPRDNQLNRRRHCGQQKLVQSHQSPPEPRLSIRREMFSRPAKLPARLRAKAARYFRPKGDKVSRHSLYPSASRSRRSELTFNHYCSPSGPALQP